MKLTVAITGGGTVSSSPGGIDCKPKCTLNVKAGKKVVLTAYPNAGAEFAHWSTPCGQNDTCTVKMTKARTVHPYFKAEPKPPAPPPPPTPAKPGNYAGTYTDGTYVKFVVGTSGTSVSTFAFDLNGECDNGGTSAGNLYVNGPFTVQSDGSFSGTTQITLTNGSATVNVAGTVSSAGSAGGTIKVQMAFSDGNNCSSKGTWTATDQS